MPAPQVAAKYLEEGPAGVYSFRPAWASEAAIAAIAPRPDSPEWLKAEVASVRAGLLGLRQNVLLLADSEEPDSFYPRWVGV